LARSPEEVTVGEKNVEPEPAKNPPRAIGAEDLVTFTEIARRVVDQKLAPSMSQQRVSRLAASDPDWPVPREDWIRVGRAWLVPWEPIRNYFENRRPQPGRPPGDKTAADPATPA
jgi:hypothetical protein